MEGITVNGSFIECDPNQVSDGYHTFEELYDHRCLLFINLILSYPDLSFASYKHDDDSAWDGWFITGCKLDAGMITYHLPVKFVFLIPTNMWIEKAPAWDGHTSATVLHRLSFEAEIKKSILEQ